MSAASSAEAPAPVPAHHNSEEPTWFAALTTYLGFAVLILSGHVRDFLARVTGRSRYFKRGGLEEVSARACASVCARPCAGSRRGAHARTRR